MKHEKICPVCSNLYTTYIEKQKTCSKECMGLSQRGINNPNYGNLWTDEQKQKLSLYNKNIGEIISERVREDWKNNKERRIKASNIMSTTMLQLYKNKPELWNKKHSDETKKLIGIKSSLKFTEEFKIAQRNIKELNGVWTPLKDLSDSQIYYKEANWISKMFDIVPNGLDIVKQHGIFNCKLNPNGVVRDHIVGRKVGFTLGVFPEILRHPCNCQIIAHKENISKGQKGKGRPDMDITIEELFTKIENYTDYWEEHNLVLSLIKKFKEGTKWSRKELIR